MYIISKGKTPPQNLRRFLTACLIRFSKMHMNILCCQNNRLLQSFEWFPPRIDPLSFGVLCEKKHPFCTKTIESLWILIHIIRKIYKIKAKVALFLKEWKSERNENQKKNKIILMLRNIQNVEDWKILAQIKNSQKYEWR